MTLLRAGLIGHPVAHSRSPALQQEAFDALGIPARYELWDTEPYDLPARVTALRGADMLGANVTIPYKITVCDLLDAVRSEEARLTGAVNTIVCAQSGDCVALAGHNTDVSALRRIFTEQARQLSGVRVLVLGAGGAARSAVAGALLDGAVPWVAARRPEAGRALLTEMGQRIALPAASQAFDLLDVRALTEALRETAILVNATPLGTLDSTVSPMPLALLDALPMGAFVFDMVYNPPATALVRAATARGLRASGGLPMLLYQGAAAFTLWTGQPAPLEVMRAALGLV